MAKENKGRKVVKCPGRFNQLREYLYNEILPVVIEDRQRVTLQDLSDSWHVLYDEVYRFDANKDPYYFEKDPNADIQRLIKNPNVDVLRNPPTKDCFSLVPLIADPLHLDKNIVRDYAISRENTSDLANYLEEMGKKPRRFMEEVLDKETRAIILPTNTKKLVNLANYVVNANFGIGSISGGGTKGGGVRSDAPYLLEVYYHPPTGEPNLVSLIGFWAQGNEMIVSQMQPCRKASFPEGVQFGVGCLKIAETAARAMGFSKMSVYSARAHPIFKEHPNDWGQFGKDFVCMWDSSAKKLDFEGSRNAFYEKNLKKDTGAFLVSEVKKAKGNHNRKRK